jgi:Flp pilus assembly protein TadG
LLAKKRRAIHVTHLSRIRTAQRKPSERGQALVEFGLVLPLLVVVVVAFIEFAFAFSTMNSLTFAARDIARVGIEGGDRSGTDCSMLANLERTFGASSDESGISDVRIFWSDSNGNVLNGAINTYQRTGSMTCTTVKGSTVTLPYTMTGASYPESQRCTVILGCSTLSPAHPSVDTLGVRIEYAYSWKTPLSSLLLLPPTITFVADQQMRIEPVL